LVKTEWPATLLEYAVLLYAQTSTHYSEAANLFLHAIQWESCCWTQSMCYHAVVITYVDNYIPTYLCPNSVAHSKTALFSFFWERVCWPKHQTISCKLKLRRWIPKKKKR